MAHPEAEGYVLVVDDSPGARDVIADILGSHGIAVRTTGSATAAMRIMRARSPALVTIDLFMPGESGFALRSAMLRDPALARVPVIVVSGYWAKAPEALEVVGVINKPIDIDRFLALVDDIIGRTQQPAAEQPAGVG
jgi:DNA-binding NtrC family response regulator